MLNRCMLEMSFKKHICLLLSLAMLFSFCACERKDDIETTEEKETVSSTEVAECEENSTPAKAAVEIVCGDGTETEMYASVVSYSNGSVSGDGPLVFMSEAEHFAMIEKDIPLTYLDKGAFIHVPEIERTEATYGNTVCVYDENYERLAQDLTLSEVYERMTAEWKDRTLYLSFSVWFVKDTEPKLHTHNMYYVKAYTKVTEEEPAFAPMEERVEIMLSDGTVIQPYSEMMWFTKGEAMGAGDVMSVSVPWLLSEIADDLSLVIIDGNSKLSVSAREGVSILGGRKVDVYDEEFNLLQEDVLFYDLARTIAQKWKGRTLYLYFAVRFTDDSIPHHGHAIQNAYFACVYSSMVLPVEIEDECMILAADGETWQRMAHWSSLYDSIITSALVPTVTIGEDSEIRITVRDGVRIIKGGDLIDVYGENMTALAEKITLDELISRFETERQSSSVYIFVPVIFLDTGLNGEYARTVSYEYAARIEPCNTES